MTKLVIDTDELYELREAATFLEIGIATLYRWLKQGKIIPLRIGRRTFIPKVEVERIKNA